MVMNRLIHSIDFCLHQTEDFLDFVLCLRKAFGKSAEGSLESTLPVLRGVALTNGILSGIEVAGKTIDLAVCNLDIIRQSENDVLSPLDAAVGQDEFQGVSQIEVLSKLEANTSRLDGFEAFCRGK